MPSGLFQASLRRATRNLIACAALSLPVVAGAAVELKPSEVEFFEKKVRPILVERCYECHSTSAKKLKGGLHLDTREGWAKGGDSGPAIVPGEVEKSLFIKVSRWTDPDLQMPPKNKLPATEIAVLEEWVKMGAPDPRTASALALGASLDQASSRTNHWAYQPPRRQPPPAVGDAAWARNDIDRFLLGAMEAKNLKPAPDADPTTLARRVYFDLTGLPPTPEQLDEFMRDASPGAYAMLVDRLLASPRYGEQWARHWFDVVRFAESVTLRGFVFKEAWRYRDYVIDSFNRDVPYDQFLREQISGDLLPHASREQRNRQLIAATFLTLGNWNLEEQDKKQLDMDVVDEQLDTIGKAFLGQTLGCARCHDHKFDPIPTRDYYAMAGILRNSRTLKHANVSEWLEVPLVVPDDEEKVLQQHEAVLAALKKEILMAKDSARAAALAGADPLPGATNDARRTVVNPGDLPGVVVDSAKARLIGQWKHSQVSRHYIGDGYWHDLDQGKGEKTLTFVPEITMPGRYEVRFAYSHSASRATNVPVTVFHADGDTTLLVNEQEAPVLEGRFASLGTFRFEANGFGYVLVANEGTRGFVTADAVQFLPADAAAPVASLSSPGTGAGKKPGDADGVTTRLRTLEAKLKTLQQTGPKRPMAMSVVETNGIEDCPVHIRGSVHNLGAIAPRGFLTVASRGPAPKLPANESGRREFAAWIAGAENPLTARVLVNRAWHWLFGEGLVHTPDNFGTTGEAPSHPELLDYLALRFVEEGWSVKRLVRELVLSRVYQLSAKTREGTSVDAENRLLSHARRRRLNAESLRDAMLQASGELRLDGRGPTYETNRVADFGFQFEEPLRSVYAPVFRNALPEIFEAFDFAPPSMVTGRRNISTVPTQALFLLNHPFVREQARITARRVLAALFRDEAARIDYASRLILGRSQTLAERELANRHFAATTNREEAFTEFIHALFASADFRYLD